MATRQRVEDLTIGDTKTFILATTIESGASAGSTKSVTTGTTFLGLDPDRQTPGTATSSGTTATIVDTARTEADSFWVGCSVELEDLTDGKRYRSVVTASTQSTTTIAVRGFPVTTAANDRYTFPHYPLLTSTAAGMSGNSGTQTVTGSDMTGYAGRRLLVYHGDFGTDAEDHVLEFNVVERDDISWR